jgi:rhamnosyltransferase
VHNIDQHINSKIAAVVILYYPDEVIVDNIRTYYSYVDRIYIYDNSEHPAQEIDWAAYPKIDYCYYGQNRGVAERLNSAAARAIADGYEWLLTMDQDSKFMPQAIENYFRCFCAFEHKEETALFGPVHFKEDPKIKSDCQWQQAERIITSGALLNLSLFNQIGCFDEALFIDSVDCDYCIRAKLAGYSIVQFTSTVMLHQLGTVVRRSSIKTLFLVKKQKDLHSPLRCYYMLRNMLYLKNKYRNANPPELRKLQKDVKGRIKRSLLYGRSSRTLFRYLLLAYKDFRRNKMGKFTGLEKKVN